MQQHKTWQPIAAWKRVNVMEARAINDDTIRNNTRFAGLVL